MSWQTYREVQLRQRSLVLAVVIILLIRYKYKERDGGQTAEREQREQRDDKLVPVCRKTSPDVILPNKPGKHEKLRLDSDSLILLTSLNQQEPWRSLRVRQRRGRRRARVSWRWSPTARCGYVRGQRAGCSTSGSTPVSSPAPAGLPCYIISAPRVFYSEYW